VRPATVRAADAEVDAGVTLIEVLVSMVIMSIFMAMFFAGISKVFQVSYHAESASVAQSQVNLVFLRLDKEIRYASGISTQGVVGGDPYIEYLTTSGGTPVCTQLRLHGDDHQLQQRTWTQGDDPLVLTAWKPLASQVTAAQPFTFVAADATYNFQRMKLDLSSTDGDGTGMATRHTLVTFAALNTTLGTVSVAVCGEGRALP
jgi:prepilin-type N-terminal cleavage/methylation domain-containing protein